MLDSARLQNVLDDAIDDFAARVMRLAPPVPAAARSPITPLGKEVLRVVAEHPEGVTANGLADQTGVGLAPMFQELRVLVEANHLLRVVRREDQLPIYVLPGQARS